MKIANIYVSITGYIFQGIIIHWWRINIQHFMLNHRLFHNISIETY